MTTPQHRTDTAPRGLRPARELATGRPHGDRVRYLAGCRCDQCRAANTAYARQRGAAIRAGNWNGLVSAERARAHMLALAEQGVGRRAVQAATDVADSVLCKIRLGTRTQIRAATERAILAVGIEQAADCALVDAAPTWVLIRELQQAGFTRGRIGRELGQKSGKLQLGRERITVRSAHLVQRIHARLMASGEVLVDAAPSWVLIRALREELYTDMQIARAIGFDDGALALGRRRIPQALAERIADTHRRLTA